MENMEFKNELGNVDNWFKAPNFLFDNLDAVNDLSYVEFRLLLFIVRKTAGWDKMGDAISYSQIQAHTRLCNKTIKSSIDSLVEKDYIAVFKADTNTKENAINFYYINSAKLYHNQTNKDESQIKEHLSQISRFFPKSENEIQTKVESDSTKSTESENEILESANDSVEKWNQIQTEVESNSTKLESNSTKSEKTWNQIPKNWNEIERQKTYKDTKKKDNLSTSKETKEDLDEIDFSSSSLVTKKTKDKEDLVIDKDKEDLDNSFNRVSFDITEDSCLEDLNITDDSYVNSIYTNKFSDKSVVIKNSDLASDEYHIASLEEMKSFCKLYALDLDMLQKFYNYNRKSAWKDKSGNKIKFWKRALLSFYVVYKPTPKNNNNNTFNNSKTEDLDISYNRDAEVDLTTMCDSDDFQYSTKY